MAGVATMVEDTTAEATAVVTKVTMVDTKITMAVMTVTKITMTITRITMITMIVMIAHMITTNTIAMIVVHHGVVILKTSMLRI